jgi:hypothetical protein
MARYRRTDTRWIRSACVLVGYLVAVLALFAMPVGDGFVLPAPLALSAPPLLYALLAIVLVRPASPVRRLTWVGAACLVHVLLGVLATAELMVVGGMSVAAAAGHIFSSFTSAVALTVAATALALASFAQPAIAVPHGETGTPREDTALSRGERARGEGSSARPVAASTAPSGPPFARRTPAGPMSERRPETSATAASTPAAAKPGPVTAASATPATPELAPTTTVPTAATAEPTPTMTIPTRLTAQPRSTTMAAAPAAASTRATVAAMVAPARAGAGAVDSVAAVAAAPSGPSSPIASAPARAAAAPDDAMVRVSFARIAPQLPADAFVLPVERLGDSLKEPQVLLVPRRIVLAQMQRGGISIDWSTVAPQFPPLALGMSEAEFRRRYPDLKLALPVDEVIAQLPADTVPLVSAIIEADRVSGAAPPKSPPFNGLPGPTNTPVPPAAAPAAVTPPSVRAASASPAPSVFAARGRATASAAAMPAADLIDRGVVARIVACFDAAGTFEAMAVRAEATPLVALIAPGLPSEPIAAYAGRLLRFLSGSPGELVTVRTTRLVLVLAAATPPIVIAASRPGAPTALLELRAARAATMLGGAVSMPAPRPARALRALVDARAADAGRALASFGTLEPAVFGDAAERVYAFTVASRDPAPLGELALGVCEALRGVVLEPDCLVSVVFHRAGERTLIRPLGSAGAVLAASGPVRCPGRAHRDADRVATMLEAP